MHGALGMGETAKRCETNGRGAAPVWGRSGAWMGANAPLGRLKAAHIASPFCVEKDEEKPGTDSVVGGFLRHDMHVWEQ